MPAAVRDVVALGNAQQQSGVNASVARASTSRNLGGRVVSLLRTVVPLDWRKRAAVWVGRQARIPNRHWHAANLVRDLGETDPDAYHRFLWSNHLAYAQSYEPEKRFGPSNIRPERHLLFQNLREFLGVEVADRDIRSMLEVGCSLGHLLQYVESQVFPTARVLEGLDIDEYAVRKGNLWLKARGSRARLIAADMAAMDAVLETDKVYDVVLCAGVLMYLREEQAACVVQSMLRRAGRLLVLSGLAHPHQDNSKLVRSEPRARDGAFIHNLDAMVTRAGGSILFRRWDALAAPGCNTPYFLFCSRQRT